MRSSSGVAFIRSAPPLTPLPHVSFFLSALLSIRPGGLVGYACASERVSVPVNERVRERERERERVLQEQMAGAPPTDDPIRWPRLFISCQQTVL